MKNYYFSEEGILIPFDKINYVNFGERGATVFVGPISVHLDPSPTFTFKIQYLQYLECSQI